MKCENVFEVKQGMTEEPLKTCPKCKGAVRRLISPAGIVFKGSGFHVTDYGTRNMGLETKKTDQTPKATETKSSPAVASPKTSK